MLEVLARIPGRPKVASKYVETDVARAMVLLRGFHGDLRGFKEESALTCKGRPDFKINSTAF